MAAIESVSANSFISPSQLIGLREVKQRESVVDNRELIGDKNDPLRLSDDAKKEKKAEAAEKKAVEELKRIDSEVRAHEQAHKAVAGRFANGAPAFRLERGPDGKFYAVGGEVKIDVSEESTPEGTIEKMRVVRMAALAPGEPSSQDRAVAAKAIAIEAEARRELSLEEAEKGKETSINGNINSFNGFQFNQNNSDDAKGSGIVFNKAEGNFLDIFA